MSLLLLQLFPNQHRSGLRQSEGGPLTSESMGSLCPGGCRGPGGRHWQLPRGTGKSGQRAGEPGDPSVRCRGPAGWQSLVSAIPWPSNGDAK